MVDFFLLQYQPFNLFCSHYTRLSSLFLKEYYVPLFVFYILFISFLRILIFSDIKCNINEIIITMNVFYHCRLYQWNIQLLLDGTTLLLWLCQSHTATLELSSGFYFSPQIASEIEN